MESVSPYSPTSSLHDDMVVPYPSLPIMTRPESIGRHPLSGNEAVVIRKNQTGSTKYDERDDAVAPGENSNDRGRSLHGNTNPLLQNKLGARGHKHHNQYPDGLQHKYQIRNHSSTWYPRRNHFLTKGSPYFLDHPPRLSVAMIPITHDDTPRRSYHHMPMYHDTRGISSSVERVGATQWPQVYHTQRHFPRSCPSRRDRTGILSSRVVIPENIVIPKEITTAVSGDIESTTSDSFGKRSNDTDTPSPPPLSTKRVKLRESLDGPFNKLDLLCSATVDLGPMQKNLSGCSCPKSKCIALYCECFRAGILCDPKICTCLNCSNKCGNPARSQAIQRILRRSPNAFKDRGSKKTSGGGEGCNCVRSQCLKLYCTCFQAGRECDPSICTCIDCLNTESDANGRRMRAINALLEKRPDAFKPKSKVKERGSGCACKNNQCIKKYCECFRTSLKCTKKCSCRDCKNR